MTGLQFIRLKALYPSTKLWALPDIEVVWKAHLIRPLPYKKVSIHLVTQASPESQPRYPQEMLSIFGGIIEHEELRGNRNLLHITETVWEKEYAEPYLPSWCTPRLLAPFMDENTSGDFLDPAQVPSRLNAAECPSWESIRAAISATPRWVIEDANWLPDLRRFLDVETVRTRKLGSCGG